MSVPAAHRVVLRALPLFLAAVVVAAEPGSPATATPVTAVENPAADPLDLGRGLRYFRLGGDAADEPAFTAARNAPALVLDLRLASGATAELRLRELLAQRDATHPLFVLLGPATSASLRTALPTTPGVLTLAAPEAGISAGVIVAADPVRDRAAAEALAAGRPPRELVEEKIEKPRFDEARLTRNHANGRREDDRDETAAESKPPANGTAATPPPPSQDMLLQRAVFIHRALLALSRIPAHT